ncbi:MAG TPA: response regulator, partial [Nitrospira sp.]|nr:response regulator [Nitrospira sp.]
GKLDLEVIEFDLRLAVEESLDLMAERASSKGLNLACLFHADVPRNVIGDPGRLRQVVMNLTTNAIKFTDSGDIVVEVTAEAQSTEEASIRVAVTDTGIGISEGGRERLFQPFSQADGSTTRKYGGTGLGLAICKRLVEMMGGTIGVTSRVGQGSCFWFRVSLRKQAQTSRRDESSAIALTGLRALIVDDKAINRRILESMTRKWGMQPTLADSGLEALEILSRQHGQPRFDVVLLDINMGTTDGIELASAIKKRAEGADIRLVLLTSLGRRGDAKKAREAGLAAYLTKPVRERQLHDCLVAIITQCPVASGIPAARESSPLITRHSLAEINAKLDLRILLAEDNIINQKVAVRLFQRLGYRIDVVANGRGAVEAVSRIRYDVVFMDCQMPDMDGFEATQVIRQREAFLAGPDSPAPQDLRLRREASDERWDTSHVPIIAMTANAMQGDRERCLAAGMDDYLSKPISVDALAGVLDRINQERERSRPDKNQEAA